MFPVWQDIGIFKSTGERVTNQARAIIIKKKIDGYLSWRLK